MIWAAALAALFLLVPLGSGAQTSPFSMRWPDQTPAPSLALLDPGLKGSARLVSQDLPVRPQTRYLLQADVRRVRGDRTYNIAIDWLDGSGKHIAYDNSWMGQLLGSDLDVHYAEATSPKTAAFARLLVEVPAPGALYLSRPRLTQLPPREAELSVDLLVDASSLVVRIENRLETALDDVLVELRLPEGLSTTSLLEFDAGALGFGDVFRREIKLDGRPEAVAEAKITCDVTASGGFAQQAATPPYTAQPQIVRGSSDDLPQPELPKMDIRLGTYYFPVMLDWDRAGHGVRKVDHLNPLLGYYDETRPEVADWHIWWAVTHGISYFVFDWYYNQGFDYLNDALEQGFLKSRFRDKMQFCVDWCNEGQASEFRPVDFSTGSLLSFIRTLCDRYFGYQNYLRVDGKPVVLIHVPGRIVAAHGGWDGCKRALDAMREEARKRGHKGVYFVAVHSNTPFMPDFQRGGFDCVTAYAYGFQDVPWDPSTRSLPYESLIPRHAECFELARREARARSLDYIPSAWVGWDDSARSAANAVRTTGATPAAFRRMIEMLPTYVEKSSRLALFESWNEWGEGGQAEPEAGRYGFGRLEAIRDVLGGARGSYRVFQPDEAEVKRLEFAGSYDDVNNSYYRRYSRKLQLEKGLLLHFASPHDLWLRPVSGLTLSGELSGSLKLSATSSDPVLVGPPAMGKRASLEDVLVVRMRAGAGTKAQLFWTDNRPFTEDRSLSFEIKADGRYRTYTLPVGRHPRWRGVIDQVRFDPTDAPGELALDCLCLAPAGCVRAD